MSRECWERFPRHRLQRKPLVSDPGMRHGTCVMHVSGSMSESLNRGGGANVPGACAIHNFTYLVRGPLLNQLQTVPKPVYKLLYKKIFTKIIKHIIIIIIVRCVFIISNSIWDHVRYIHRQNLYQFVHHNISDHIVYGASQLEMALNYSAVSHWWGPYTKWSLMKLYRIYTAAIIYIAKVELISQYKLTRGIKHLAVELFKINKTDKTNLI